MGSSRLGGEFAVLPLLVIVPLVAWHARRHGHPWAVVALRVVLCAWIAALAAVALFPLDLPPYAVSEEFGSYPWVSVVPFETLRGTLSQGLAMPAWRFLAGNLLAFVPLGILAPMLSRRWRTWPQALALGLAISLSVELVQLALSLAMGFPWRVADVDDVLLNTAGTLVGFGLWRLGSALLGGRVSAQDGGAAGRLA
jgi:glycopeptide antibiotics resistance protein